ncbi:MAG TPA: hypothetical protein VKT82_22460 [Ktedonobacterales bacterium]|nr:hypothetical protein [Ktedonobacterales bacterium]
MQQPCNQCGSVNAPDAAICAACGAALLRPDAPQPVSAETDPALNVPTQPLSAAPPPPPHKKSPRRLALLAALVVVVIVALAGGGFLLRARPHTGQPQSAASAPPALYANSLTTDQPDWQCEAGATCAFRADGLHIDAPTDHLYFSELYGQDFGAQVIDVQARLDDGDPDFVGVAIAFRSVGIDGYGFLLFANGTYQLVRWDAQGNATNLIPLTPSAAIHTGLGRTNELKIIAQGASITLIVNGQQLQQISDSTYTTGNIALGAARFAAEAVFSHLTITKP